MNWRLTSLALCVAVAACTRTTTLLERRGMDGGPRDGAIMDARAADAASEGGARDAAGRDGGPIVTDAGLVLCGSMPCACSNGLDDDADGLVDGFDPECTGAFDEDESSFATGLPGGGRGAPCQDCFFDANAGAGDDDCRYASSCGLVGNASGGTPQCSTCDVGATCRSACLPRTPNGCDCFGCCEIRVAGQIIPIWLNDACSLETLDDATKCPRCTPNPGCFNECGECELCPGKTAADLNAACASDGLPYTCGTGAACGPAKPCSGLEYCAQGCCVLSVI